MTPGQVRLGLRENRAQFGLLVAVNAFVGAMVGLERSTLPLIGRDDFGLSSSAAVLSFIAAFGLAKAFANLGAGAYATRIGRRRLLIAGWALALPVPLLIALAPSWSWVVAANVLLGVNQGLAWSMTVVMKIDLVGPRRRGFALGLNEAAGYGGVALAAAAAGWLAADVAARDVLVAAGAGIAVVALFVSVVFVRDTAAHVALEQSRDRAGAAAAPPSMRDAFAQASWRSPALRSASQAGLANNLNDALAWGLVPLYLAAHGAAPGQIGLVAGLYPAVWGIGQIWTGHWSDRAGRKPLIVGGMLLQAAALLVLAASAGAVVAAAVAAVLLGAGTALVYPTLIAAISDAVTPVARAAMVGVYRFWRDMGYVAGALVAGVVADALGFGGAIAVVAAITAASGLWVAIDMPARPRVAEGADPPGDGRGQPPRNASASQLPLTAGSTLASTSSGPSGSAAHAPTGRRSAR
jgi:MFS family permease